MQREYCTRRRGDMNLISIFYELAQRLRKICFSNEKVKFISSSHLVFFFHYVEKPTVCTNYLKKQGINDVINIITGQGIEKSRISFEFYHWCVSSKTLI